MTGTEPALAFRGVVRRHGRTVALAGVDLTVPAGEVVALLGPNGAGKSTLVGLAAGLAAPDEGTVRVLGQDPFTARGRPPIVGLAPQEIGVYPSLTVEQNLRAFGELAGLGAGEARKRAVELAGALRLAHLRDREAGQLSGGEQRRLHTAAALVHRPRLVLLDEPTAGADVATRAALLAVVRTVAAEGTAVLYTSHYLPEIEALGAAVVLLDRGRVVTTGTIAELVAAHAPARLVLTFATDDQAAAAATRVPGAAAEGPRLTLAHPEPATAVAATLAAVGDLVERLVDVAVVHPSLEAAYTAVVGDEPDGEADESPGEPPGAPDSGATAGDAPVGIGAP